MPCDAFNLIRLDKANVIVTGGAEATISPSAVGGFNAMHAHQPATIRQRLLHARSVQVVTDLLWENEQQA